MPREQFRSWLLTLGFAALALAGCSRQAFRERADKDVEAIISQKNVVPQWGVKNWHAYPDGRARFADPSCPDEPPYPPDDYAAKVLSPNPQRPGKGGAGRFEGDGYLKQIAEWDAINRAEDAASAPASVVPPINPEPASSTGDALAEAARNALSSNERPYKIRLDQAVELAMYNSREFQDRREDLYIAALPVSLERFNFSAQAFAASSTILELAGSETSEPGNRWRLNNEVGVSRRFANGAELLVRLANQIVIDLSNGNPTVSVATLGLALSIPFLRGGGFAVTLEPLTQAERTLLYAMRSYARFRSLFYTAIAGQGDYTNNPYGLQGLSQNLGRGVGANLTANQVGYLPTILRSAILNNEKNNVRAFEYYLRLFQSQEEGGVVTKLQVGRIEQQLLQGRATVLLRTQEYIDNIDNFKLQLGVPATLPLELDEGPLSPIRDQLKNLEKVYSQLDDIDRLSSTFDPAEATTTLRSRWTKLLAESDLVKGTAFAKDYPKFAEEWRAKTIEDVRKRLLELRERRRLLQDARAEMLKQSKPADKQNRELELLEAEYDRLTFEEQLRRYESKPWAKETDAKKRENDRQAEFRSVNSFGLLVSIQARNERLEAEQKRWPNVPPIVVDDGDLLTIPLDDAYQRVAVAALNNRFDLMNSRAQVVDAWRQVTIRANALRGLFDVEYDLSVNSPTGTSQPFNFSGRRILQQIRLRWEPPFVRREERNLYRAALISYQRQRRNLMAFEDNIVTDVRTGLRLLRQLAQTFQVQRTAVELAYLQADNAKGTLLAPPDPAAAGNQAAAQTEQLLQVQAALVRAQNDLYSTWVRYLNARMNLYVDLEQLPLDARGIWTDDARTSPAVEAQPAVAVPIPGRTDVGRSPAAPIDPGAGGASKPERIVLPAPASGGDANIPDSLPVLSLPEIDATSPKRISVAPEPFPPIELPKPGPAGPAGSVVPPK